MIVGDWIVVPRVLSLGVGLGLGPAGIFAFWMVRRGLVVSGAASGAYA